MPTLRFAFWVALYLSIGFTSNGLSKQGSGWDPLGLTAPAPPPPAETEQGSQWDPLG